MLTKLGKQIKLPINENFIIKYGTINAINPQCIFVSIHSWATPKHNLRFDKKLRALNYNIKSKIHKSINYDVFYPRYIVDFDLRISGLQKNKPSFLSIEIALYPKQIVPFPSDIYDSNIINLVKDITNDIKRNNNFIFTAKKNKLCKK